MRFAQAALQTLQATRGLKSPRWGPEKGNFDFDFDFDFRVGRQRKEGEEEEEEKVEEYNSPKQRSQK